MAMHLVELSLAPLQTIAGLILQTIYTISMLGLAIYGFHALWLSRQTTRRPEVRQPLPPLPTSWPAVTVQLPIYNEQYVAQRIIDACAQLDYPHNKLEVQVLDDSDDSTSTLIQQRVEVWQARGVNVKVVTRPTRHGFKAGALDHALPQACGEFIAIFDADFLPDRNFLRRSIPYLLPAQRQRTAFVQTRWGHLNRDYSPLTRSQALALDGHFVVEQQGRQATGYFFGFNGSGGVWRRACIEDPKVGGWQPDTLCEDLDLSYRAQLAGWQPLYVNDITAPAEIPPTLTAFKRQQFRWAKGSIQTLCKLSGRVWHSHEPLSKRIFGLFHLGSYLLHPLLLALLFVALPLMLLGSDPAAPLALLSVTTVGPPLLYAIAQRRLYPDRWLRHYSYLPLLMLLGTGIALSNTRAVWQGLRTQGGTFLRTPKFRVDENGDHWKRSAYHLDLDALFFGELAICLYALLSAGIAAYLGKWWSVPFLLLYACGFGTMVGIGFVQAWQSRRGMRWANRHGRSVDYQGDQAGA